MKIFVVMLDGWRREISVNENTETVAHLKQTVVNELRNEQLTVDQIHLFFKESEITSDRLWIRDCGIRPGDTVNVVVRQRNFIRITVMHERRQIPLDVEHSELVQNLKIKIQEREGFSVDQQVLMFQGREINGRLNHSGVGDGSTLQLCFKKVQIFVRDFEGRSHTFEVHLTDKVQDFKKQVERKIGVTASQQRLEYAGRQLMDGQRLLDYGIQQNSTLELKGRLRGG
ncbi:uncharacterized protein LOC120344754 [Styela clava]